MRRPCADCSCQRGWRSGETASLTTGDACVDSLVARLQREADWLGVRTRLARETNRETKNCNLALETACGYRIGDLQQRVDHAAVAKAEAAANVAAGAKVHDKCGQPIKPKNVAVADVVAGAQICVERRSI